MAIWNVPHRQTTAKKASRGKLELQTRHSMSANVFFPHCGPATCPVCRPVFALWQLGRTPADLHDPEVRNKRVPKQYEGISA